MVFSLYNINIGYRNDRVFSHTNPYILNVTQQCRCSQMLIFGAWATCDIIIVSWSLLNISTIHLNAIYNTIPHNNFIESIFLSRVESRGFHVEGEGTSRGSREPFFFQFFFLEEVIIDAINVIKKIRRI